MSQYTTFFLFSLKDECIPRTHDEVLAMCHWKKAMEKELRALGENQTCKVEIFLPAKNRNIYLMDVSKWYKAKLVAQGYT